MSDNFSRKFVESARLPSRSLTEIKQAVEDGVTRIKRVHEPRVGGEVFSITALVNSILTWWAMQPTEVQDRIALDGADLCNQLLKVPLDQLPARLATLRLSEGRALTSTNIPILEPEPVQETPAPRRSVEPTKRLIRP
ncbi:hypothetical protein [Paludisphaera mucosa]|uniref:Uncharacterized protein n=1 Tax=Paludisphaera mucosa TaxID=3030827 RepID=A0ABT6F6R2_9BACT|nr:hypothetical protein [Paludisphaera mucosa]MDG3003277.1 hypothetical protein [Paludisphaera mucosa]